ncbi:tyrosine-type recombinase/integrase [Paenibacillus sp. PL91]|uniref:tyrosine-type recombinase/integrase n=1 Tax=Paenibacillus sp. PL91 TaxID=2729538 RepID=UPI00145D0194|nr:site-specific integrase [Paenibacillus sp. PL91]MBC9199812.1 site-specific integrase [Paenibacillus sp. PL91]
MVRIKKIKNVMTVNWTEALEQFLFWKKAQGISEQTYKDYNQQVRLFFKRYPDSFESIENLKHNVFHYLGQDDIKPCTFNNRLVYLRTFLNWCLEQTIVKSNPLQSIKKRKDEGRVVSIDQDVLRRLLDLPDKQTFTGLRDFALILLTLDTGIRPKEALSLSIQDFNSSSQEIYITSVKAKTRVSRTLPISIPTVRAIRQVISVRPSEWTEDVPIFCTCEGNMLNRHTWGDRLERYSKTLGYHIRPYDLRHSFALEYIRNGANALTLQKTLGHSDLTMTKRYVALTNNDLKREHSLASPINNLMPETKRLRKL